MVSKYNKYILIGAFIALLVLSAWIIKSYVIAILTSAVLAYIFYPVFKLINKGIKHKFTAALVATILVLLVLIVPLALSANTLTREAYLIYLSSKQRLLSGDILHNCNNLACEAIKSWSGNIKVQFYIQEALKTATNYVLNGLSKFVLGIPNLIINIFIAFFVMFYSFKDGDLFVKKLQQVLKLHEREHKTIVSKINDVMYAVVYGNISIALIQGLIGAISFWAFGISSPIIWGIIMAILSFAPYVGTAMIWIPASLILIFDGVSNNENLLIWKGLALFIINLMAGVLADNIIKPNFIGQRSNVHPVLILLGIFGGIALFGIAGFIIGPVVLALTATLIDLYISKNNE